MGGSPSDQVGDSYLAGQFPLLSVVGWSAYIVISRSCSSSQFGRGAPCAGLMDTFGWRCRSARRDETLTDRAGVILLRTIRGMQRQSMRYSGTHKVPEWGDRCRNLFAFINPVTMVIMVVTGGQGVRMPALSGVGGQWLCTGLLWHIEVLAWLLD